MPKVSSFAATHPGTIRAHNEDRLLALPDVGLWAVADGAGGHASGELAAGLLVEALARVPPGLSPEETLAHIRQVVIAVHAALREAAASGIIASTLVVLLLRGGHFAVLWAGDSRAYLLRDGMLRQITHDHSLVQALLDRGAITPAEAGQHPRANVILRAIGAEGDGGELDKVFGPIAAGDCFLLCSDGLNKVMPDTAVQDCLGAADPAAALVAAAVAAGARDNVTAVVVQVDAVPRSGA